MSFTSNTAAPSAPLLAQPSFRWNLKGANPKTDFKFISGTTELSELLLKIYTAISANDPSGATAFFNASNIMGIQNAALATSHTSAKP